MAVLTTLAVGDAVVADYRDGADLEAVLAPRPHLHEVRTLGGAVVTDAVPDDHRWHLGVNVGVQDVAGANLWGGRTYVRDRGYTWRDDHGRMAHAGWRSLGPSGFDEDLGWHGPDGGLLLRERREVSVGAVPEGWALELAFTLDTDTPLELGSPATNGRERAGYGGFFWRLPRPAGPAGFLTPEAEGEEAVHYARADWLAYRGDDGDPAHPFTLVVTGSDDPWFVRLEGYPGLGSALAPETPVPLLPGTPLTRRFTVVVADGHLDAPQIATAASRSLRPR